MLRPVHPEHSKTPSVQPFDIADVMVPEYFKLYARTNHIAYFSM